MIRRRFDNDVGAVEKTLGGGGEGGGWGGEAMRAQKRGSDGECWHLAAKDIDYLGVNDEKFKRDKVGG